MATSAGSTYAGAAVPGRRSAARSTRASRAVHVRAADEKKEDFDARAFRRELSKTDQYSRKFGKDEESAKAMEDAGIGMVSRGVRTRNHDSTPARGAAVGLLARGEGKCGGGGKKKKKKLG